MDHMKKSPSELERLTNLIPKIQNCLLENNPMICQEDYEVVVKSLIAVLSAYGNIYSKLSDREMFFENCKDSLRKMIRF